MLHHSATSHLNQPKLRITKINTGQLIGLMMSVGLTVKISSNVMQSHLNYRCSAQGTFHPFPGNRALGQEPR